MWKDCSAWQYLFTRLDCTKSRSKKAKKSVYADLRHIQFWRKLSTLQCRHISSSATSSWILSGAPTVPEILSSRTSGHRDKYELSWRLTSYFPMVDNRVDIRIVVSHLVPSIDDKNNNNIGVHATTLS